MAFGGLATVVVIDAISFLGTAVLIALIPPNASFRAAVDIATVSTLAPRGQSCAG